MIIYSGKKQRHRTFSPKRGNYSPVALEWISLRRSSHLVRTQFYDEDPATAPTSPF